MKLLHKFKRFYYLYNLKKKYYRSGKCNRCGCCCEKIYVKHGSSIICDKETFEKLQKMHKFYANLEVVGSDETGLIFKCNFLDPLTRLCTNHKNRDRICAQYPQEEIFSMGASLSDGCGYKFTPIIPFSEVFEKVLKSDKKYKF